MAAYFLDSSAAVKFYVRERGSVWLSSLVRSAGSNELFVVRLTVVEIAATLFRRVKGASLSRQEAATALSTLRRDLEWSFQLVEFNPAVSDLALLLAERHGLRGYDCIQLAAALTVKGLREATHLPPPELLSADMELNAAARAEGLQVVDPNDYP